MTISTHCGAWLFVFLVLGMSSGDVYAQDLSEIINYDGDGNASDMYGSLEIVEKPQVPSEGCTLAGLTYGAYEIRDSNPQRNSQAEWHYQGRMNGYCLSSKSKAFHRGKVLVCDDVNFVTPLVGRRFCEIAEQSASSRREQLQENIDLSKQLDMTNRQLSDALVQLEVLKRCLVAPKICPLYNPVH